MLKKNLKSLTSTSLSKQLIGLILSWYFGIAITLTSLQLLSEFNHEKDNLSKQISGLAETFKPTITEALWNYEDQQINATLEGLYKNPEVYGISIQNNDGKTWRLGYFKDTQGRVHEDYSNKALQFTTKVLDLSPSYNQLYHSSHTLTKEDNGNIENIGTQTIYYSSATVIERTWMTFIITILGAIIKTLCLWGISIVVINKIVAKPINQLKDNINTFDVKSLVIDPTKLHKKENTYPTKTQHKNELDELQKSFYLFCASLTKSNRDIEDYKQTLESKVIRRTQSLNDALNKAFEANQIKSEFLATMSHEIRTPMNAVIGTVQLLKKTELTHQQKKLLDTINYGGKTLMTIINDILDLSKIEANRLDLETIPFELQELLELSINSFKSNASDKGISLNFHQEINSSPIYLLGDPTRITQIINNLLSNAIKFTDKGVVILALTDIAHENNELRFRIAVQDTGIGMSKAQQESLFNAFSQADSSTTRLYGGTGLGLAISKRLVEAMGGEIIVDSSPMLGSKFSIVLQLTQASKEAYTEANHRSQTIETPQHIATILIADDVNINCDIASCMLEDQGHKIITVHDGVEAVDTYTKLNDDIDIILMDCLMPNMDGFEATRQIRLLEEESNDMPIPIIALTASALDESKEKCFNAGMNGFISKPFEETELLNEIQEQLKQLSANNNDTPYSPNNSSRGFDA